MSQDNTKTYSVAVVATMSAGKSTLLNAMMVEDILPTSNQACTSTVFHIVNDDNAKQFIGRFIKQKEPSVWQNVDKKILKQWNESNVDFIEISGDLPVINNASMDTRMILFDTPGPNNSSDKSHYEITRKVIEESDYSNIVCVLNITQLATFDEKELLLLLKDFYSKRNGGFNILFALNQIDEIDLDEEETIKETGKKLVYFLESLGFESPIIIPTSAKTSFSVRYLQKTAVPIPDEDLEQIKSYSNDYVPGIPAYKCSFSMKKQIELKSKLELLQIHQKSYKACLQNSKSLYRYWLTIRASMFDIAQKQFLIADTFYSAKKLGQLDLLCGTAFLEKALEVSMLEYYGLAPSIYSLRKKIKKNKRAKQKLTISHPPKKHRLTSKR